MSQILSSDSLENDRFASQDDKGERVVSPECRHTKSLSNADFPNVMNKSLGVLTYGFAVFECFGEGRREP